MSLFFAYSSLPPPDFTHSSRMSLKSFYELVELTLTTDQKKKLASLSTLIDIKNIFSLEMGISFDPKGNFSEAILRLCLQNSEDLPVYILEFLEENKEKEDRIKHFPKLYTMFFKEEISKGGVAGEFLNFERDLNLLLFGFTGKKLAINLEKFLQYEDLSDPLVTQILLQRKNSGTFIFPFEYKDLEEALNQTGADPMKQYLAVSVYRFNFYRTIFENDPCTFRSVCAYMMCLWIQDEKASMDEKLGRKVLIEIVENENE